MAFDSETGEMFCPKCKQSFEEGSRRFCPSDGTRLVFEPTESTESQADRGIFSHLLPKSEVFRDHDETMTDVPRFVVTEPSKSFLEEETGSVRKSEAFFEIGDIQPDFEAESDLLNIVESTPPAAKIPERKVNPLDIPPGHVDLETADRSPIGTNDFTRDDPEGFVGRTVKGRYYVTELFDEDETGFAYLADDRIVENKKVLVHILSDEDDEIMDSIYAEERGSLSHLNHPNVARLIDSGEFTDGTDFLVTEFVDALTVR